MVDKFVVHNQVKWITLPIRALHFHFGVQQQRLINESRFVHPPHKQLGCPFDTRHFHAPNIMCTRDQSKPHADSLKRKHGERPECIMAVQCCLADAVGEFQEDQWSAIRGLQLHKPNAKVQKRVVDWCVVRCCCREVWRPCFYGQGARLSQEKYYAHNQCYRASQRNWHGKAHPYSMDFAGHNSKPVTGRGTEGLE